MPSLEGFLIRHRAAEPEKFADLSLSVTKQGNQGLKVGDHVRVKLIHIEVQRGFINFARV